MRASRKEKKVVKKYSPWVERMSKEDWRLYANTTGQDIDYYSRYGYQNTAIDDADYGFDGAGFEGWA